MNTTARPNWALSAVLGLFALVRPAVRIVASQQEIDLPTLVPLALTVAITVVWVLAAVLTGDRNPVHTLAAAGLVYAVGAVVVSGVLSPLLDGELRGPLANPIAVVPMLVVNVGWGLVAGALALGVQRMGRRRRSAELGEDPRA